MVIKYGIRTERDNIKIKISLQDITQSDINPKITGTATPNAYRYALHHGVQAMIV